MEKGVAMKFCQLFLTGCTKASIRRVPRPSSLALLNLDSKPPVHVENKE